MDVVPLAELGEELEPGAANCADVKHDADRIEPGDSRPPNEAFVDELDLVDRREPLANSDQPRERLAEQFLAAGRQLAAGSVERGEQQRALAGRAQDPNRATERSFVNSLAAAKVKDCALRHRATKLVRARENGVGAELERARR